MLQSVEASGDTNGHQRHDISVNSIIRQSNMAVYYLLLVDLSRLLLLLYLQEHMPHDIDDFSIEPPFVGDVLLLCLFDEG